AYAFTDGETTQASLTYRELWDEVRGLAGAMQSQIEPGQRILLLYPPGLDFVVGLFACHALGAIAVPAFPPRRNRKASRIRSIVTDADTRIAFATEAIAEQLVGGTRHEDLEGVTVIGTDSASLRDAKAWKEPRNLGPDQLAILQYTSGSTGSPKGVMLTHRNVLANCEMIIDGFEPKREYRGMAWLPAYHDMGLVGGILQPMYFGRDATLMSPMTFLQRPARWLQTISRLGIQISGGPNFAYQLCVDKIDDAELSGVDLSCWKIAFNGAEPIRPSTLAAFTARFAKFGFERSAFTPCYGMAETTLMVTAGPSISRPVVKAFDGPQLDKKVAKEVQAGDPDARELVGCGQILPNEVVKIVDPHTMTVLADGGIGEIWVQSPSVGQGYWQAAVPTGNTFGGRTADGEGPFLRTGDLGFLHEGQLYISGRLKDMIIVRGVNRYPQDIEQTVESASAAVQAGSVAAFAMTYQDREQLVVVAETVRQRGLDWDDQLQKIRRAVTAEHELPPDAVYLVRNSSVPKTSSGKIQRHACLDAVLQNDLKVVAKWVRWEEIAGGFRQAGPAMMSARAANGAASSRSGMPGQATPNASVVAVVESQIREVAGERAGELSVDTNIVLDLGLDSLERLEIARGLEETFGGRFPQEILDSIETVGETALAIQQHLSPNAVAIAARLDLNEIRGKRPRRRDADLENANGEASTAEKTLARAEEPEDTIEQFPEYKRLQQTTAQMLMTGVPNPYFTVHESVVRDTTIIGGREMISFASYNYIGMSGERRVSEAAMKAIEKYGTSVSASRLVSGEKPVHGQLEARIAGWIGVDASITMVGGHATNETTIGHLLGPGDLIVHDSLSHNSIVQGALLSGARRRPFPHNDYEQLDNLLTKVRGQHRRVLIVVEGVYSMDGDFADIPALIEVKRRHRAMLMVDEAHSMGTMGATGHGISEHFGIDPHDVDIWMGTLSKSFASCGGYIAGSKALIEYLRYTAPGFVFSVGLPPASAAAALASIDVLEEQPERVEVLRARSELFLSLAKRAGLDTGASGGTPVIPIITGNSLAALRLSHRMFNDGINVQPILYPAVDESAARLRFFMTCLHSEEQIRFTIGRLVHHLESMGRLTAPAT
ncbi:MAG: aminotransferase class I/II-fold pyridoxal phosphate-dependent enzyme, partial [Planctomycetaceae bacterium]